VQPNLNPSSLTGLLVAFAIVVLWIVSLELLLSVDIDQLISLWVLAAILGRTFIQTGLFIVAHDAIHGAVLPSLGVASRLKHRQLNDWIGRLAVTLYALLSYRKLSINHWQYHRHPGQASDPDFHDGTHRNIWAWYLKFMQGYLDLRQKVVLFFGIGTIFLTLHAGLHVPAANLFLFWVLPIGLSSMQLFLFGTYLPHRIAEDDVLMCSVSSTQSANAINSHHATSSNYPLIWSFLTCYHFGYHWEHHEYPYLPWYRLLSVRQPKRQRLFIPKLIKADIRSVLQS
jgi:beta-carotene/zeaxanthin 4-ketolase